MYDTELSDYKVTNSPFGRDPVRELADAIAKRRDIKLVNVPKGKPAVQPGS